MQRDMRDIKKLLFALVRSAVTGEPLTEGEKRLVGEKTLAEAFRLATAHDLLHLAVFAAKKNGLNSQNLSEANEPFKAVYRAELLTEELKSLSAVLNDSRVSFIPLKGSIIRQYYPEPWMRTSCDIDVLVRECDLAAASSALCAALGWSKNGEKSSHDVTLCSPSGAHIELHYTLIEDFVLKRANRILDNIWDYAILAEPSSGGYEFRLKDEAFYFYHVAHMAKHVVLGGCGIKPFVDLYILNKKFDRRSENFANLLELGGLKIFAEKCSALSENWFGGAESDKDAVCSLLEEYVISGGVYGTIENKASVGQGKKGGKLKNIFGRIWLPYEDLVYHYPSLKGKKALLPFYQIRRWCKLIFKGGASRGLKEIRINASVNKNQVACAMSMLAELGLEQNKPEPKNKK